MAYGEVQVKPKEGSAWQKESPIVDMQRLNEETVYNAKLAFGSFITPPIKKYLEGKKGSQFLEIISNLSTKSVQAVSLASGKKMDAYSMSVVTNKGPQVLTLVVDDISEQLSRSIRKGGKDIIQEMLIHKKGELGYSQRPV